MATEVGAGPELVLAVAALAALGAAIVMRRRGGPRRHGEAAGPEQGIGRKAGT